MVQTNMAAPRVTVIDPGAPERARLRVAAYARVSSDSADQRNSYLAQVDFYSKYIASHEEWELADIYSDEGISGLEARKRDDFNRMMADCRAGKIDRILCKSISRFARNTKEYIQFVRELLRLGISVCFEKENIDTGRMTSEQVAQIYGAFAQMESTNHSSNMRISVRMRMEKGLFVSPSAPYGYHMEDQELAITEDEAEVVRQIYRAYLNGSGVSDIAKELNRQGIERGKGRRQWGAHAVTYILTNIAYTGNMIWQKFISTDTIPFQKAKNRGEKPMYFIENAHPAIVSQEDFRLVQERMEKRKAQFRCGAGTVEGSVYSKHIFCSKCGSMCHRKLRHNGPFWVCHRHDAGKDGCPLPQMPESEITAAVLRLYRKLRQDGGGLLGTLLGRLRELRERELRANRKIIDIDREIAYISEQNLVLTRLKSKGYIDPALSLSQQDELTRKLKTLRKLRRRILEAAEGDSAIKATEEIMDYLSSGPAWPEEVAADMFGSLIERIAITEEGTLKLRLINGLELTEQTERTVY